MADRRVPGERFTFDEGVWGEEVGRLGPTGRAHAAARAVIQRPAARIAVRRCEGDSADGTRLAGCAKVYVPLAIVSLPNVALGYLEDEVEDDRCRIHRIE